MTRFLFGLILIVKGSEALQQCLWEGAWFLFSVCGSLCLPVCGEGPAGSRRSRAGSPVTTRGEGAAELVGEVPTRGRDLSFSISPAHQAGRRVGLRCGDLCFDSGHPGNVQQGLLQQNEEDRCVH